MRDVIFNEDKTFTGDLKEFKDELATTSPDFIKKFVKKHSLPDMDYLVEAEDEEEAI